ncbi:MAG: DUF2079 domain-containing protein [Acutalibacteraceae bacterium]|nr:DUF2079 domain-containing protein [Acutalibacteraceae bacterium]
MSNKTTNNGLAKQVENFLKLVPLDYIFAAFCTGFCLSSFITLITTEGKYTELAYVTNVNLELTLFTAVFVAAALIFVCFFIKNKTVIPVALLISSTLFGSTLAYKGCSVNNASTENIYMNIGIAFVMFLVIGWICKDNKIELDTIKLPKNSSFAMAGIGIIVFTILVSIASIARYNAYMAQNFDFGIFAQMFENMRTTGLPNTTVERNTLMSHFGVHFSPFYYILLPFYAICPRPETLLVIQALFVSLGAIPVVLICKHFKFSELITALCCMIYLFYPTLANGCLYDFHENKFLTVLIMWAMYFIVKEKWIGIVIFCALILTVKEDAAIYVMSIALYMIITRKQYWLGGAILAGAVIYFSIATSVVATLGEGVMTNRLDNYMPGDEAGFSAVVKTCLANFGYFISQIFVADKIMFMCWMLIPVAFAPFISKNRTLIVLLIPMLVVDLMSNWKYQYDVKFQYTYGVAGLILFMLYLVISEANPKTRSFMLNFSLSMCIVMSFSLFFPRAAYYSRCEESNAEMAEKYNKLISTIPTDAEITADGIYIPHMYNFPELYQYPNVHGSNVKTDYLLVSHNNVMNNTDELATFIGDDYIMIDQAGDMCLYQLNKL